MGKHIHTLKALRDVAFDHARSAQPDLASMARELGRLAHQHAPSMSQALAHVRRRAHGFERWLLAESSKPAAVSMLIMAWPANYSTSVHDHAGLWGLEMAISGALEVQAYQRDTIDGQLRMHGRTWLGPGDATWFDAEQPHYAHRCRNLSRHETALTLHVYGGNLSQYFAYEQAEASERWQSLPRQAALTGRLRLA